MTVEAPMCYTVDGMYAMLEAHGPLWVATDICYPDDDCAHAIVVTGMLGDGTPEHTVLYINDPDDATGNYDENQGEQYTLTYKEFAEKLENLGSDDLDYMEKGDFYIAHF